MFELENNNDIEKTSEFGWTLLHFSCRHKNLSTTKLLLEKGADITSTTQQKNTPLHLACQNSINLPLVKLLLERKADIQCENISGMTPLHYAV